MPAVDQAAFAVPFAIGSLVVAAAFAIVGGRTRSRASSRATGGIMVAIGASILAHSLYVAGSAELAVFGLFISHLTPVLIGHLLLVYPSGKFDARYQAWLVALGYFDALVLALPWIVTFDPLIQCSDCAPNPVLMTTESGISQALAVMRLTLSAVMTTGLAIALTQRWSAASPTQRAALGPMICAGGGTIGAFAVLFVTEVAGADPAVLNALNFAVLGLALTIPAAASYGQAKTKYTREGAVRDLIAAIGAHGGRPSGIEAALARAIGDPTLRFAYWLPALKRFGDADGAALPDSERAPDRCWFRVEMNGEPVAAIIYSQRIGDQSKLLGAAGSAAALALENARLQAALRAQVAELQDSRARLVEATDQERRRIERDLHDGAQQHLISIGMNLNFAADRIDADPDEAKEMIAAAAVALTDVTNELRDLARGIHSALLADRGLAAAVQTLAGRSVLPVRVVELANAELPPAVESTAYFVVSESLANAARSSQASSVKLRVTLDSDELVIEVSDNGVGGADPSNGTGLMGLEDRVATLGGTLEVASPDGGGTVVRAVLPLLGADTTVNGRQPQLQQ